MYIDLSEFPAGLATLLTTTSEIAGLILCVIIFVVTAIPFLAMLRGQNPLVPLVALSVVECITFSLVGWLAWWVTIVVVMGVCGVYALVAGNGGG